MTLDRYRLLAQLGAGPDGISYRAAVEGHGRRGTGRGPRPEPGAGGRRALGMTGSSAPAGGAARASLGGPRPRARGSMDDPPYVVLEWVGTATLAEAAGSAGPIVPKATELVASLAGALEEAHRLGLAHGRLGPGQVLLGRRPAQARLHRHRRRFPGRVVGLARARRRLPRSRTGTAAVRRPTARPTSTAWASCSSGC